jgi:hypothetical protein
VTAFLAVDSSVPLSHDQKPHDCEVDTCETSERLARIGLRSFRLVVR